MKPRANRASTTSRGSAWRSLRPTARSRSSAMTVSTRPTKPSTTQRDVAPPPLRRRSCDGPLLEDRTWRRPGRRVVVVRALPGLGDLLCATPAVRALRQAAPGVDVRLLGLPVAERLLPHWDGLVDGVLP